MPNTPDKGFSGRTEITTTKGSGATKIAVYPNAGKVGGVTVDLVAKVVQATLDPKFVVIHNRPAVESAGKDDVWIDWYIYEAGTYKLATDSGGVAVEAEVVVQFTDLDGPNNESLFVPVCAPPVEYVRINKTSTLGTKFGTVAGVKEVLSVVGDKDYDNTKIIPQSGAEVTYSTTSVFRIGRTASALYYVTLDDSGLSKSDSYDFKCSDFRMPVAIDDNRQGEIGVPVTIQLLDNDGVDSATGTFSAVTPPTDFAMASVNLLPPAGASGIKKDAKGDVVGFTVPGQGTWSYEDLTGKLTFTPLAGYRGTPTPIQYTFKNATGGISNQAKVTIGYPEIQLVKTAKPPAVFKVGEVITYAFKISNPSAVALTDVRINDPMPGIDLKGGPIDLAAGTSEKPTVDDTSFVATYKLTEADIGKGGGFQIVNSATVSGDLPDGKTVTSPPSSVPVTIPGRSSLAIVKTAGEATGGTAGKDTITYSFVVTNTGNTRLTNVKVVDPLVKDLLADKTIASLDAGADARITVVYVLKQADIDKKQVVNTATATGTPPADAPPLDPVVPSTITTKILVPGLSLVKSAAPLTERKAGAKIAYTFAVKNTGDVALTAIAIRDDKLDAPAECPATPLLPKTETTCTGTHTITAADVTAAKVVNTATASGLQPDGKTRTPESPESKVTVDLSAPGMSLVKTANLQGSSVGSTIDYTFAVKNTGNALLKNLIITDEKLSPAEVCKIAELPAGSETACHGKYSLTQADVTARKVTNSATVNGDDPDGNPLIPVPSDPVVTIIPISELKVEKQAAEPAVKQVGATIDYTFKITNTGNVTLRNVTLADDLKGIVLTGSPISALEPGKSDATSYSAKYTLTQADINAGQVINKASVTSSRPGGNPFLPLSTGEIPPADIVNEKVPSNEVVVKIGPSPALTIVKKQISPVGTAVGQMIPYEFTVTNTGNVTLAGITINDDKLKPGSITCTLKDKPDSLTELAPAPGENIAICRGEHELTQADIDAGSVTNLATATGTPPAGPPVTSPPSEVTTKIVPAPGLTVKKTAGIATVTATDKEVTYAFALQNTGNVTLRDIVVTDGKFSPADICTIARIEPGAADSCTKAYT
ncbi:MAG: DUF7507 domain-containing protein, partial [Phyllobacterium sp.]